MEKTIKKLIFATLLSVLLGKGLTGMKSRCARRLSGKGVVVYPKGGFNQRVPNIYTAGEKLEKNCILWGKMGWSKKSVLNITDLSEGSEIKIRQFYDQLAISHGIMKNGSITLEGKPFIYFKIIFPRIGTKIRVSYSIAKYKSLRCSSLKKKTKNLLTPCTKGWGLESACTIKCKPGYVLRNPHSKGDHRKFSHIEASCRLNAEGQPRWETELEVVAKERDEVPGGLVIPEQYIFGGKAFDVFDGKCEVAQCNDLSENFRIGHCTNGMNHLSNCTVRCRRGFVPAPHTYEAKTFYPTRASEAWIWTVCKVSKGYASWKPSYKDINSEISCFSLSVVELLCFSDTFGFMDGGRAYVSGPSGCRYTTEQLLEFFNEGYDGEDYLEPVPRTTSAPVRVIPEVAALQKHVEHLNSREKRKLRESFRKYLYWNEKCIENFLVATDTLPSLTNTPALDPTVNEEEVKSAFKLLNKEFGEDCSNAMNVQVIYDDLQCSQYCLWENGKLKPCGQFGLKHARNCLRCKKSNSCTQSEYLG